jgi:multidrug efflux pump subunit AcrB
LIAVFIPLLFMSGIVGRLFREFGVVVTVAVALSAVIALTLSPMMASLVLQDPKTARHGALYRWSERGYQKLIRGYESGLKFTLRHQRPTMALNLLLIVLAGWLFYAMPKGFFPQEDTGMLFGFSQADPDISFAGMSERMEAVNKLIAEDPDVSAFGASIGGTNSSGLNTGRIFIQLKPFKQRSANADQTAFDTSATMTPSSSMPSTLSNSTAMTCAGSHWRREKLRSRACWLVRVLACG